MRQFSRWVSTLTLLCTLVSAPVAATETITLLDKGEPYDAMTAEDGVFWIAHSRRQFNTDYRLEAWSPAGELLASARFPHSLNIIKTVPTGGVMVTGINPNTRLTQYTHARLSGRSITLRTTTIELGGFITFWIGQIGSKHWFVDQGGNPNDTDIVNAAQTIFSASPNRARYLSSRVRMPVDGHVDGENLWLISSAGIGSSSAKVVVVNTRTEGQSELHASSSAGYSMMEVLPGGREIALNARFENKVVVLNKTNGEVTKEFPTGGFTRSIAKFGHCILAGNDESNSVEAFDLREGASVQAVATAQVTLSADEFSGIKRIAVDQSTGTVFARAAVACNPLIDACDKDRNRVVSLGEEFAALLRSSCGG